MSDTIEPVDSSSHTSIRSNEMTDIPKDLLERAKKAIFHGVPLQALYPSQTELVNNVIQFAQAECERVLEVERQESHETASYHKKWISSLQDKIEKERALVDLLVKALEHIVRCQKRSVKGHTMTVVEQIADEVLSKYKKRRE